MLCLKILGFRFRRMLQATFTITTEKDAYSREVSKLFDHHNVFFIYQTLTKRFRHHVEVYGKYNLNFKSRRYVVNLSTSSNKIF